MKEFLDAYKQLEKLCSEIYNEQHGITQYITDMERTLTYNANTVPNWDQDLKELKRLRHLRNAMVHDTMDDGMDYTKEDIKFLQEFYRRIMEQRDPISLSRKRTQNITSKKSTRTFPTKEHTSIYVPQKLDIVTPKKSRDAFAIKVWIAILGFFIVMAIVALICTF